MALSFLTSANELFIDTFTTTANDLSGSKISVAKPFPKAGMSGIVMHRYGDGYEAVSGVVVAQDDGSLRILNEDLIPHPSLPSPKRVVQKGDRVIAGYLYDRVVAVAPTQALYEQLTNRFEKRWLHPDHLALFMAQEGEEVLTKELVKAFAKMHHIGLLLIVTDKALLLYDPLSAKVVNQSAFEANTKGVAGFYHRLGKLNKGLFGSGKIAPYESIIGALVK